MKKRTKILLITAAVVLLAIAAALNYKLEYLSERAKICNRINEFGYSLGFDDIYVTGDTPNVSISELLPDIELKEAAEASKACGFPSDVTRVGHITVALAALSENEVATVYIIDGEIELCFIQILDSDEVYPLCRE